MILIRLHRSGSIVSLSGLRRRNRFKTFGSLTVLPRRGMLLQGSVTGALERCVDTLLQICALFGPHMGRTRFPNKEENGPNDRNGFSAQKSGLPTWADFSLNFLFPEPAMSWRMNRWPDVPFSRAGGSALTSGQGISLPLHWSRFTEYQYLSDHSEHILIACGFRHVLPSPGLPINCEYSVKETIGTELMMKTWNAKENSDFAEVAVPPRHMSWVQ